jgi:zinc protease
MTAIDRFPPRPTAGAPRPYRFPARESRALPLGARLVVAPLHRVPLVSIVVLCPGAGAASEAPGREGLAALTAAMLLEGTTTRNGQALTDAFEALGASVWASADWDTATVGVTTPTRHAAAAVALLTELLRTPAFHAPDLARLQAEHAADRLQMLAEPRALAELASQWCLYAPDARYRRSLRGTTATIAGLTTDAVRDYWAGHYSPASMTIVVAGDVAADTAEQLVTPIVAGWTTTTTGRVDGAAAARFDAPRIHLVDRPDAPQSELRLTRIAVPRTHPDFYALTLMNAVFGGLFSSRINLNLRERHGYTYGASAGFDWRRGPGPWSASTAVGTDVTIPAIRELLHETARMREGTCTDDELLLASSYLTGVFPLRYETTQAVASALSSQAIFDLPEDYFDTYRDALSAVTVADIDRVAAQHLRAESLQLIVVGDATRLRDELAALALGPVEEHSAETIERAP